MWIGQDSTKLSEDMSKRLPRKLEILTKDSPVLGGPDQKVYMAATVLPFPLTAVRLSAVKTQS